MEDVPTPVEVTPREKSRTPLFVGAVIGVLILAGLPLGYLWWHYRLVKTPTSPTVGANENSPDGYLRVQNVQGYFLQFVPIAAGSPSFVASLSTSFWPHLYVYKDRLYTLDSGTIEIIDPFLKTKSPLAGVVTSSGETVGNFYIRGDRLWYLVGEGESCGYGATCVYKLYEVLASGGTPKFLTQTPVLLDVSVLGFDSNKQAVYVISSSENDCGGYAVYEYSYADASTTEVVSDANRCSNDAQLSAIHRATLDGILLTVGTAQQASTTKMSAGHLSIPEGTPQPSTTTPQNENFVFPLP